MAIVVWVLLLTAAFLGCRWSGRMLDQHYNDRLEVGAVLVVAACVFVPMALSASLEEIGDTATKLSLGVAICGGLLLGRRQTPV
jgi:predicted MFS family arabinose efflux permease